MKNLILISLLTLSIINSIFSQKMHDYIDIDNINYSMIVDTIINDLNEQRKIHGLPELTYKKVNEMATKYHTDYLLENGGKSRIHTKKYKEVILTTPQDRINYFSKMYNEDKTDVKIRCSHYIRDNYKGKLKYTYKEYNNKIVNHIKSFTEFYDSETKYYGINVSVGNIDLGGGYNFYTIVIGLILTSDSDSL